MLSTDDKSVGLVSRPQYGTRNDTRQHEGEEGTDSLVEGSHAEEI